MIIETLIASLVVAVLYIIIMLIFTKNRKENVVNILMAGALVAIVYFIITLILDNFF